MIKCRECPRSTTGVATPVVSPDVSPDVQYQTISLITKPYPTSMPILVSKHLLFSDFNLELYELRYWLSKFYQMKCSSLWSLSLCLGLGLSHGIDLVMVWVWVFDRVSIRVLRFFSQYKS